MNVNVSATDLASGNTSPTNCATVTLAEVDPNTADNTGCAMVQINSPVTDLSLTKTAASSSIVAADRSRSH